jgi:serine/threonine protein kinase
LINFIEYQQMSSSTTTEAIIMTSPSSPSSNTTSSSTAPALTATTTITSPTPANTTARSLNQTFYTASDEDSAIMQQQQQQQQQQTNLQPTTSSTTHDEELLTSNNNTPISTPILMTPPQITSPENMGMTTPNSPIIQQQQQQLTQTPPPPSSSLLPPLPPSATSAATAINTSNNNNNNTPLIQHNHNSLDDFDEIHQIDCYELLEEVGRGAQGVVYKCRDVNTNEIYAIKELKGMAGKLTTFLTEISIMKKLNHPNLTKLFKVYDAPHMSSSMYFVMDYIEGGPVMKDSEVLSRTASPMSVDEAQTVFKQFIRGLNYLHHNGVIHRDIKPSNILRDRRTGIVKLSDFGVSSLTSESKAAKIIGEDDIVYVGTCGTPAFLSPEGLGAGHDHAYHGRPADVWAAGVTLFVFLYGVLPFSDPNGDLTETMNLIIEQDLKFPPKPSGIPKPVKDLLLKMLEKDPAKRATLSWVSSHPWVGVGNWKKEGNTIGGIDVEKPTAADTTSALSIPTMINRVRKTSSGMAKKVSAAAMSLGSMRKQSLGGASLASSNYSSMNNHNSSPKLGNKNINTSKRGPTAETVNQIGDRLSAGSGTSLNLPGGHGDLETKPLLAGENHLEGHKSSSTSPNGDGQQQADPLDQFIHYILENLCCLDR